MKKKMSLNSILKNIELNNKVLFSFNSILLTEIRLFDKLFKKFLKIKAKLDWRDPTFIDYHPLVNYVNMIKDLSIFFWEFFNKLNSQKKIDNFTMDFYQWLRKTFFILWKIKKLYNNHDFPKNIFSRGIHISQIRFFRVSSELIIIGQFLNEKKNKIFKIISNICAKIKKYVLDKENTTKS